jgi:hypothetical protein
VGNGTISALTNQGILAPGASPGQIALDVYTQTKTGVLEIELAGTGPNDIDRLMILGEASLAGTLNVSLIDEFVPSAGQTFDFLSAVGGITGVFDTIRLPSLPDGLSWSVNDEDPTKFQLFVTASLSGDYNGDGSVDAADYVVWRKNEGTSQDYNTWRANFGATADGAAAVALSGDTGSASVSAAVPEPAFLLLLAIAGAGLTLLMRPCIRATRLQRDLAARCCSSVLGVILALSTMSHHVLGQPAPGVEEGDLFVGASSSNFFGQPAAPHGVFRVRDGVVTPFSLGSADPSDPGFFDVPRGVIVDSQGRVVWLAPIGDIAARNFTNHVGLFRASGEGATPERLAIFRVGNHALDEGYPNPFPDLRIANNSGGPPVIGLHLASNRRIEIDDDVEGGKPRVVTEEAYVMGLILGPGGVGDFTDAKTVSYGATTGVWDDHLPKPIYESQHFGPPVDMVSHAGAIYSIDGNGLRRSSAPVRVDASGSIDLGSAGNIDFSLGLRLFGGDQNVRGIILDDTKIPNVPCNCAEGAPDPPHHLIPSEPGYSPMSGFQSLAYDPGLGLVISSNTGFVGPYLTRIGGPLLNDNPQDDIDAYFYWPEAGDLPSPSLQVTRLVAKHQFGDPDSGIPYPVNRSVTGTPGGGGLVALHGGSVVRVMENGRAEVLATGLLGPNALGSYPTYSSPATGLSVIIRVDSPVDVLLTAPDGRQIGVDPATGLPVNDFG